MDVIEVLNIPIQTLHIRPSSSLAQVLPRGLSTMNWS